MRKKKTEDNYVTCPYCGTPPTILFYDLDENLTGCIIECPNENCGFGINERCSDPYMAYENALKRWENIKKEI